MNSITPLITVDTIEPCLPFWTGALGFETIATVPHEGALGFAMLQKGEVVLMYQSRASLEADLGASGAPAELGRELAAGTATLFIKVDEIDEIESRIGDAEIVVPRRQTFYGMDELFVRAPCGTLVGFAAPLQDAEGTPAPD